MSDATSKPPETGVTAPAPKAPAPAAPAKPAAAKAAAKPGAQRRFFLLALLGSWAALGWLTLSASLLGMLAGTVRFLFPNVLSEPPSKFKAGPPEQYEDGKVVDRYKDQNAWIVRVRDDKGRSIMYSLSTTCTHLGCTPNWLEREQKFKCPCHGSGFYISGINFEGPAPRPLERWGITIGDDGQIIVDKSKKFQYERDEWTKPDSYIVV
jgi:cytochrome b6-f complex iron-sulfur subunit